VVSAERELTARRFAQGIAAGDFLGLTAALKGQLGSSDAYVVIEVDGKKVAWYVMPARAWSVVA
jgi:hypothetical protein